MERNKVMEYINGIRTNITSVNLVKICSMGKEISLQSSFIIEECLKMGNGKEKDVIEIIFLSLFILVIFRIIDLMVTVK